MLTDEQRADQILAELASDSKAQMVVADARVFGELREQPGWQRLYSMVKASKQGWLDHLAREFMRDPQYWPKPIDIQFYRGYYKGAWWIVAHPEVAERNLERLARREWARGLLKEEGIDA